MKRIIFLVLIVVISLNAWSYAQEDRESMNPESSSQGQSKGKMMGMMQKDTVVATSDGGVVIKQGSRLIKYDASLNLVKEIELPRGKKPESRQDKSAVAE